MVFNNCTKIVSKKPLDSNWVVYDLLVFSKQYVNNFVGKFEIYKIYCRENNVF